VTEYASLRDFGRRHVKQITDLLAGALDVGDERAAPGRAAVGARSKIDEWISN